MMSFVAYCLCSVTLSTAGTVQSPCLQLVLFSHPVYSWYRSVTLSTAGTVQSPCLQLVLFSHPVYSWYCSVTLSTANTHRNMYWYHVTVRILTECLGQSCADIMTTHNPALTFC